jgi:hypothetical protein
LVLNIEFTQPRVFLLEVTNLFGTTLHGLAEKGAAAQREVERERRARADATFRKGDARLEWAAAVHEALRRAWDTFACFDAAFHCVDVTQQVDAHGERLPVDIIVPSPTRLSIMSH